MIILDNRWIYLIGTIILLVLYSLVFLFRRDLRQIMLFSSIAILPFGPLTEILFFKDYWYPPSFFEMHLFGIRILPEDLLYAFTVPTLGALSYIILTNSKYNKMEIDTKLFFVRFYILAALFMVFFYGITILLKVNSIFSCTISALLTSILILYKRPDLTNMFIKTSIVSAIITFFGYFICLAVFSDKYLNSVWLLNPKVYGFIFFGVTIPLTEILFSAVVFPFVATLIFFSSNGSINKDYSAKPTRSS